MAKIKIEKHDSVKMYRIRKTLDEISDKTGHGTELITVYIPKGKQLHEVISILKEEQGTADNIKSDFTRSHVVDSLGKVIQRLKMYKKTPERGLVVFCGALPPEGGGPIGSEVVRAYEIDPPKDLKTFLYRCDDHFHVDILKDMLKDDNLIGFLAIDAKDAGWGLLHGDRIDVLSESAPQNTTRPRSGVFLYIFSRCMTLPSESTTCDRVKSDFILSAVPCSSFRMLITSCSCFPFGMYTVISSVPCPVLSEISSSVLRMRYILTESCFSIFIFAIFYPHTIRVISLLKTFNCTHK